MLSVIYAECRKQAHYAECRYAECRYAECRYADCRHSQSGDKLISLLRTFINYSYDFLTLGPRLKLQLVLSHLVNCH
jgi:hypothetical protein